ncbi:hypothetical protein [Murinocardiopsis flavida]|uniref:hypothetical protein n=1 Tax=Murinocardiopsis flavida TaxID=645275 RepID=UPI000D0CDCEF|nr:hypothetical protein [Murinocardiopsis flavida]
MVTPRPGTDVRFAVNHFHGTWHILSDLRGARFLARLMWGLSYQRRPGTIVCIGPPFLDPNPFDAEPSMPIVFGCPPASALPTGAARALRRALPLGVGDGTVRWQTHGLARFGPDPDRSGGDRWTEYRDWLGGRPESHDHVRRHLVEVRSGALVLEGAPIVLRDWAVSAHHLSFESFPMDYQELAGLTFRSGWVTDEGELQVFAEYRRMVGVARAARAEVLADPAAAADPAAYRPAIWNRGDDVKARRFPVPEPPRSGDG